MDLSFTKKQKMKKKNKIEKRLDENNIYRLFL
jgi:hypothetical protein